VRDRVPGRAGLTGAAPGRIARTAALLAVAGACAYSPADQGDDGATPDGLDVVPEEGAAGDVDADLAEGEVDAEVDAAGEAEAEADAEADVDAGPGACGNGVVEGDEACDDGNAVNEACDTTAPGACLADCSLLMSLCGNGSIDPGEHCDDGNSSSMDGCTTSCTLNDDGIGAPCACTGSECTPIDPTAGTIVGCDGLAVWAGATREVACLRSLDEPTFGVQLYFPSGYCTLIAFRCTGSICGAFREVGDVDAFSCPPDYAVVTDTESLGDSTVTTRSCHPVCSTEADCRWNEREAPDGPFPGCGQYACIPHGDAGERICIDRRQVE
jgi:cysteine-rich repeat protein